VPEAPQRSFPFGTILLLAIAGALYIAVLGTTSFSSGGGDAAFGRAMASLFFTAALWIALALLVVVGSAMGAMPRWAGVAATFLLPLSGVATFVAIDMCSRHIKWAIVFPVVLPLLIAVYALWARLPRFRAAIPTGQAAAVIWSLILVLSGAALLAASII
jgi:hypothetical protein